MSFLGCFLCENGIKNEILKHKMDTLQLYVQKVKIATAIAVIKTKPPEMCLEEYVATLGEQILTHSNDCEVKSSLIEKLVQNLELSMGQDQLEITTGNCVALASKDNCNELAFNTFDLQEFSNSSVLASNGYVGFMSSILFLKRITLSADPINDELNLFSSVLKSLSRIFEYLKSDHGLKLAISDVEKFLKIISDVLNIKDSILANNVKQISLAFIISLISDIVYTTDINMIEKQHRYSSIVQIISQHPSLTADVLFKLITEIIHFHKSIQEGSTMDTYKLQPIIVVENMYFVFQTLSGIVYFTFTLKNSPEKSPSFPENIIIEWKKMISDITDSPVSYLSMFYTYVFQIHSLFTAKFSSFRAVTDF